MLLAIDTSSSTAVAVLDEAGAVLSQQQDDDPRGHAEHIGPLLQRALTEAGRPPIDAVAYGVGPGPFTGLRVGMAAGRSAAYVFGAVELPVLSHDAIAYAARLAGRSVPFVVSADAKRGERFFSVYRGLDAAEIPVAEGGPRVGRDVPDLPSADLPLSAVHLGQVALLRRAAGIAPEPASARYLRSPDVTLAARKRVGA